MDCHGGKLAKFCRAPPLVAGNIGVFPRLEREIVGLSRNRVGDLTPIAHFAVWAPRVANI
jgi:hypothetical protein